MRTSSSSLRSPLVGARHPRVRSVPEYELTQGPAVTALMELAGKPLDPWQADGMDDMLAIGPDGQWACFEYCEIIARQQGKSVEFEARLLGGLLLLDEELIMYSAHEFKTTMELFRRVGALIANLERDGYIGPGTVFGPIKTSHSNGDEGYERLDTGQRIKFLARSKNSGRGFSGDVNVLDEAYALTEDQLAAMMPTALARPNPQLVFGSSPPLNGMSGEKLFDLRRRALSPTPGPIGFRQFGGAVIPGQNGTPDREATLDDLADVDLDDRELWAAAAPALGGRVPEGRIATMRSSLKAATFAREVLCIWPKRIEGGGAIDHDQWDRLCDELSRRAGDIALGVDISPWRDYAAIDVYGAREDGLEHSQLVRYRAGVDWLVPDLAELATALDPVAIGMGVGTFRSLREDLKQHGLVEPEDPAKPLRGQIAVCAGGDMAAACGQLLDVVRREGLRHTGQAEKDAAVKGAQVTRRGDVLAWSRTDPDVDTSPVVAMTVGRWAWRTRADAIHVPDEGGPNLW